MEEHELGNDATERVFLYHIFVCLMYCAVIIVEIGVVCLSIQFFLASVHCFEIFEIIGVFHRYAVVAFGEFVNDGLSIFLGLFAIVLAHRHYI